jgi:predicted Zn-dependent protease
MILKEKETRDILNRLLSLTRADEAAAIISGGSSALSRFANNQVTQNVDRSSFVLNLAVAFGKKEGSSSIDKFDDESLKKLVNRAEEAARLSPENPEHTPPLPPADFRRVSAYDEETASYPPAKRGEAILSVCRLAKAKGIISSGTFSSGDDFVGVANSKGLFGYFPTTNSGFTVTARTPDGTGSGKGISPPEMRARDLRSIEIAKKAIDTALLSRKPKEKKPADYTVILTPDALAEFIFYLFFGFDARSADEGRSFLSDRKKGGTKLGEKLFGENINIKTVIDYPGVVVPPFSAALEIGGMMMGGGGSSPFGVGIPTKEMSWIEKGVVKNLIYSPYWAKKKGEQPTPFPTNIVMKGEDHTLDDLIASTDAGILVSNFWYIRPVDPNTLLQTGLTRDGVFFIEKGKIAYPINNFRFNESPLVLLNNIEMMTKPVKVGSGMGMLTVVLPGVKAKNFTFTSISEAV